MHKADIDKLEDILTNQNKYRQLLRLRAMTLEDNAQEEFNDKQVVNPNAQDPRTIRASNNTSVVERTITKRDSDLEYQTLYSIVYNTPKFIESLNKYEVYVYNHRYQEADLSVYEWEDIAMGLTDIASKDGKSFSKSTTLRLRNKMLVNLAERIGYTLM